MGVLTEARVNLQIPRNPSFDHGLLPDISNVEVLVGLGASFPSTRGCGFELTRAWLPHRFDPAKDPVPQDLPSTWLTRKLASTKPWTRGPQRRAPARRVWTIHRQSTAKENAVNSRIRTRVEMVLMWKAEQGTGLRGSAAPTRMAVRGPTATRTVATRLPTAKVL